MQKHWCVPLSTVTFDHPDGTELAADEHFDRDCQL